MGGLNMEPMVYQKIRIPVFILSILTTAFGIDLITAASLGTSPISSVPLVLSFYLPLTFGQMTFALNMLFIVLQFLLLRRDFRPFQFLQVGINFIFSYALDLYTPLLAGLQGSPWPLAVGLLVLGCAILGFGICIETASHVLMVPGDGIVRALSMAGKWRMGTTKVAFDTTMVTLAVIASFFYGGLGTLTGLGVGTIVSAMLVGRFVNFFNHCVGFIGRLANATL